MLHCIRWLAWMSALTLAVWAASVVWSGEPADAAAYRDIERTPLPAERTIRLLEQRLSQPGADPATWVELAEARVRRARETAQPSHYAQAHAALDQARQVGADASRVERARLAILLGEHRFVAAMDLAQSLVDERTVDPTLLGLLFDAQLELGDYDAAWTTLPRLLAVAPGTAAALARASYLTELSGQLDVAAELMARALQATPSTSIEDRAWTLVHLAHIDRLRGHHDAAAAWLRRAERLLPDYHYLLAEQARLARALGDAESELDYLQRRCGVAGHPECFFDLGAAWSRAGSPRRAADAFARFEPAALEESAHADNANGELILYYLDHDRRPRSALRLAELENRRRRDLRTRLLYGRALSAVGRHAEAMTQVRAVQAIGGSDPQWLRWIGEIEAASAAEAPSAYPRPSAHASERVEVRARADAGLGRADAASAGATGREDFEQRPLLRNGDLLESVPGLIATQHSGGGKGNQMFLRGFNLDHGTDLRVEVEGMQVNLPSHGHGQGYVDLNFLIAELVETVQFRKGGLSALDGDFAAAGSARIRLADTIDRPFVRLAGGPDGYSRGVAAGERPLGGGRLLGAFEWQQDDGPWQRPERLDRRNGMMRYIMGDAARGASVTAMAYTGRWNASEQLPERAIGTTVDRLGSLDPQLGGDSSRFSLSGAIHRVDSRRRDRLQAFAMHYDLDLASNFTYCLGAAANEECRVEGDRFRQVDDRWVVGGRVERQRLGRWGAVDWDADFGAETQWQRIDNGLGSADDFLRTDRIVQGSAGLFGEIELRPSTRVRFRAGLRADGIRVDVRSDTASNSGEQSAFRWSPKLGAVLRPWRDTELYVNAAESFHSNDARGIVQRFDPNSGAIAQPADPLVRARTVELGLRVEPGRALRTSVAWFRTDLDSELLFVGDAGTTEPGPASRRQGVEVVTHWSPRPSVRLEVDLSAIQARLRGVEAGQDRIPGALERTAAVGLTLGRPAAGWSGTVRWRAFGDFPLEQSGAVRGDSASLVHGRLSYALPGGLSFRADLFNLLDRNDADIQYFYASRLPAALSPTGQDEPVGGIEDRHRRATTPRTVRLGLEYRF